MLVARNIPALSGDEPTAGPGHRSAAAEAAHTLQPVILSKAKDPCDACSA